MIDHAEKSTEVAASAEVVPGIWLDGRLGLFHQEQGWLAVADLHYGYEISRRAAGGLWPMWGMETVEGDIEVTGHRNPAVHFHDGAGTRLKLPALVMENDADETCQLWTLPAFSPWAGGGHYEPIDEGSFYREWACSPQRVFEVIE